MTAFVPRHRLRDAPLEHLEARLVQRPDLVDLWCERLHDSLAGGARRHLALVGGDGLGKTHLLALIAARLTASSDDTRASGPASASDDAPPSSRAAVAWLPEDEPTSSWSVLLLRVLRALHDAEGQAFPEPPAEAVAETDEARRGDLLATHLLGHLGERTLVVIVERLDDVLSGLGDEGARRWRAFLQQQRAVTLASTPHLTEALVDRQQPFFNFFELEHLAPLPVATAAELVARLVAPHAHTPSPVTPGGTADDAGRDLAGFVRSPAGVARLAALAHLLGSAPRTLVELADGLTAGDLDALLPPVERLVDRRTPRARELLRRLPNQQREIVAFLCRQPRPVPVKAIAVALALTPQTAASQLKGLRDKGYVVSSTQGRESRYEVADPSLALGLEVVASSRAALAARVAFLRAWFDGHAAADAAPPADDATRARILSTATDPDPVAAVARLLDEADAAGSLPELAVSLVRALGHESTVLDAPTGNRRWSDAWHAAADEHPVLAPAARMVEVGLAWLARREERVLLDLSRGERALLRQALGLPPS